MILTKRTTLGDLNAFEKRALKNFTLTKQQKELILTYAFTVSGTEPLELSSFENKDDCRVIVEEGKDNVISEIYPQLIVKTPKVRKKAPTKPNKTHIKPIEKKVVFSSGVRENNSQNGLNGVMQLANEEKVYLGEDYEGNLEKLRIQSNKRIRNLKKDWMAKKKLDKLANKLKKKEEKRRKKYGI